MRLGRTGNPNASGLHTPDFIRLLVVGFLRFGLTRPPDHYSSTVPHRRFA